MMLQLHEEMPAVRKGAVPWSLSELPVGYTCFYSVSLNCLYLCFDSSFSLPAFDDVLCECFGLPWVLPFSSFNYFCARALNKV